MNQLLFLLILIALIWLIFKVSRWIWRIASFVILLIVIWYFRETINSSLTQYSEWIPNPEIRANVQQFLQTFFEKLNQFGQTVTNLIQ